MRLFAIVHEHVSGTVSRTTPARGSGFRRSVQVQRIARVAGAAVLCLCAWGAAAQQGAGIAREFHRQQAPAIIADFAEFLRLPNVASNLEDMAANARFIQAYIAKRGFTSRIVSGGGAPYVIAERPGSPGAPTVLIYAHYDGQPVVPESWVSPPFEPTLWSALPGTAGAQRLDLEQTEYNPEWRLTARAAGDDKAPVIALMAAIDALTGAGAMPDVGIKLFLDGEEERGSPTLGRILEQVGDELDADVLLFCDGPMHQSRRRQLTLGVRGSMTIDLTTFGPNRPLHSGHYGNWAPNPNEIMMRLLLSMKDAQGRPRIEGFMEDVTPVSPSERAAVAAMPRIDEGLMAELGLSSSEVSGERVEEAILRPAIVVRGLYGGAVADRARNIIEPDAQASINVRLVPGQTPEVVVQQFRAHFEAQGMIVSESEPPPGATREKHLRLTVRPGGYRAFRTPVDAPVVARLKRIMDRLPGPETLITPTMGGSLPIYRFEDTLDMPIVILPIANHDNNQHGRNENLRLQNLFDAIELYAEILVGLEAS
jgi:acetylornithine deacetylase/succinyl-diaminopimelate desuccinylase-like protein